MKKYSWSEYGEAYYGEFDTVEDAIAEASQHITEGGRFYVGENTAPTQPEEWWFAEDWLEVVSVSEEYGCEWAEGWDESTKEQRKELQDEVRPILAAWLDRNNLRPAFWNVINPQEWYIVDGVPQRKPR